MVNKIYKSGELPADFTESIFIVIPKTNNATECGDFRTLSMITHTSKIILQIIKKRIGPIIDSKIADSQLGFRRNRGTTEAITQVRVLGERMIEKKKDVFHRLRKGIRQNKALKADVHT